MKQQQNKRPRLQSTSDSGNQEEITKNAKTDVYMSSIYDHHLGLKMGYFLV